MSQYFELLNSNVYDKKNIVTYRWLSRKLNVNVNQAKKILYEFKVNESNKIHCIYCISGQLKRNNEIKIELVSEDELEDTKKKFQYSFIHIYSIEVQNLKELDPLVAENYDIINDIEDNPQSYSMVKCTDIHKKEREIEQGSIDQIQDIKPEPVEKSSFNNNKIIKDIKKEKNDFFKKTANNKKNKTKDIKNSFFEKFKTKSVFEVDNNSSDQKSIKKERNNSMDSILKENSINVKIEESSSKQNLPKEEKKIESKDKVIVDAPELSEEEKKKKKIELERKLKHEKELEEENERLKRLFDDDDISNSITNSSGKKKVFIDDEDEDNEEDNNYNIISNEEPKKLIKSDDPRKPGRKRYRVTKSRTFVDDNGYLVTEDISDWESVSETEEDTTITSIKKQKTLFNMHNSNSTKSSLEDDDNSGSKKPIKKRKGNSGTTQQSILNFFKKH